mmetsp:Transcript_11054/g.14393  ORF Transcript_11054/g.14393 Transcript_11054/m.14393 type:complete len:432 (-) Transcript_11054:198-1493(-)
MSYFNQPPGEKQLCHTVYFLIVSCILLPFLFGELFPVRESFPHQRIHTLQTQWRTLKEVRNWGSGSAVLDHQESKPSARYRLSFGLLVGETNGESDTEINGRREVISWDIDAALELYFDPLLSRLENLAAFEVDSQILYFSRLVEGNLGGDLTIKRLQSFMGVNSWDPKSILQDDLEVQLHFMLFLPTHRGNSSRTLIRGSDGTLSNNFLIPGWGAVAIAEEIPTKCSHEGQSEWTDKLQNNSMDTLNGSNSAGERVPLGAKTVHLNHEELKRSLETFAGHLQKLIGLDFSQSEEEMSIKYLVYHFDQTIESLKATSSLVESMTHMTVLGRVIRRVETSCDLLGRILDQMNHQKEKPLSVSLNRIRQQLHWARSAYENAELAFFDPTLVPQLYFPLDQQLATMAPLFLPVIIPIFVNCGREALRLKKGLIK